MNYKDIEKLEERIKDLEKALYHLLVDLHYESSLNFDYTLYQDTSWEHDDEGNSG